MARVTKQTPKASEKGSANRKQVKTQQTKKKPAKERPMENQVIEQQSLQQPQSHEEPVRIQQKDRVLFTKLPMELRWMIWHIVAEDDFAAQTATGNSTENVPEDESRVSRRLGRRPTVPEQLTEEDFACLTINEDGRIQHTRPYGNRNSTALPRLLIPVRKNGHSTLFKVKLAQTYKFLHQDFIIAMGHFAVLDFVSHADLYAFHEILRSFYGNDGFLPTFHLHVRLFEPSRYPGYKDLGKHRLQNGPHGQAEDAFKHVTAWSQALRDHDYHRSFTIQLTALWRDYRRLRFCFDPILQTPIFVSLSKAMLNHVPNANFHQTRSVAAVLNVSARGFPIDERIIEAELNQGTRGFRL